MTEQISSRLKLAKSIAVEAGEMAIVMRQNQDATFAKRKSYQDFVTAADLAVEQFIRGQILKHFPDDLILGEEQGATGTSHSMWVVDPIDGTTNFMHGLSEWAVSIAYCQDQEIACSAIYAPDLSVLVSAEVGQGAYLNDRRIRVSDCALPEAALVLLGRSARHRAKDYLQNIANVLSMDMEYRRNGSAAYSLMSVAAGRAEGFYEAHLNSWDALAGLLIVSEAGGTVEYPCFGDFLTKGGPVVASNSVLHNTVRSVAFDGTGEHPIQ